MAAAQWNHGGLPTEPVQRSPAQAPVSKSPESPNVNRILSPLKAAAAAAEEAKRLLSLSNSWSLDSTLQPGLRLPRSGQDLWSTSSPLAGLPPGSVLSEDNLDVGLLRNPRSWEACSNASKLETPPVWAPTSDLSSNFRARALQFGPQSPKSPWGSPDQGPEEEQQQQQQPQQQLQQDKDTLFRQQQEAQLKDLHQQQQRIRHELEHQQSQQQQLNRSRSPLPSFGVIQQESGISELRLRKALQDLQENFEHRLKQFDQALEEKLSERFQQINDDISWAGSLSDTLGKRFEQFSTIFEKTIEDLAKRADLAENSIEALGAELEAKLAEQGSLVKQESAQQDQDRLRSLEQGLAGLQERMKRLEEEAYGEQGWGSRLKEHDVKLQGLRSKLDSQDNHFATFSEAAKQDWEKRFKGLQDSVRDQSSQQLGLGEKIDSIHRWTEATEDAMDDLRKVCERSFSPSLTTKFSLQSVRADGSVGASQGGSSADRQKLPGFGSQQTEGGGSSTHSDSKGNALAGGAVSKSASGTSPPQKSPSPTQNISPHVPQASPPQSKSQAFVDMRTPVLLDPVGVEEAPSGRASSAPPTANRVAMGPNRGVSDDAPTFGVRTSPNSANVNANVNAKYDESSSSPNLPSNSASPAISASAPSSSRQPDATASAFGVFAKQNGASKSYQSPGQSHTSSSHGQAAQKGGMDAAPRFGNFDWDSETGKEEEGLPAFGGSHRP